MQDIYVHVPLSLFFILISLLFFLALSVVESQSVVWDPAISQRPHFVAQFMDRPDKMTTVHLLHTWLAHHYDNICLSWACPING